jgi:PleD family two-component response regulator
MGQVPNVLLLCGNDAESSAATEILVQVADLTPVRTVTELKERAAASAYDALFCGSSFHQARWKNALEVIRIILGDVPVIFLSPSEDVADWTEVLEAGGFDLLVPPYSKSETRAVLGQAVESYAARGRQGIRLHQEAVVS